MNILGIGGVLGDAAAVLIKDGHIAAAIEESKLARRAPQPGRLPDASIAACLRLGGITAEDVDCVALARPLPTGGALPLALQMFHNARIVSIDHHAAHAASAFFASPFNEATVITLDVDGFLHEASDRSTRPDLARQGHEGRHRGVLEHGAARHDRQKDQSDEEPRPRFEPRLVPQHVSHLAPPFRGRSVST